MRNQQRKLTYKILAATMLSLCSFPILAQESLISKPEHRLVQLAEEEYNQGHYQMSLQSAKTFLSLKSAGTQLTGHDERERAKYFKVLSELSLGLPGAGDSAKKFVASTPNPVYQQRVSFALGQYFFRNEQLNNAIPYYENASINNLTNKEIANSKFELAYAYFNSRQFDKAEPLFASIKEVQGKYYLAGNYYYGLLAYNSGQYEQALNSFKRIDNEPQYRNIVPYYIAEIYYFMGNRNKALEEAIRLTKRPEKSYYDNELHLLAAQVLFEEQRYGDALPYFEHYYDNVEEIRKEELYEMGYSYYKVNEWKHAIEKFKPLSNAQDSLGQTAMYLLGDCYLKTGDKKGARNAFGMSADMPFNRGQQEASLLLYGKLSYELGYNDDAIRGFNTLITAFPQSSYNSEARTYLSDILIKTNKYADAYALLKDVRIKNDDYWAIWQKTTYGYGMQQLQNEDLSSARTLLTASLEQPVNADYEAAAYFWRGDIAYKQSQPANALNDLTQFVNRGKSTRNLSAISPQATLSNAYLNMGYAAMDVKNYAAAQDYFARARTGSEPNSAIAINASVREADAAFMQKDYRNALSLYDKAIDANTTESDYARLQKGILLGLQGKVNDKITLLQQVINKNPASKYSNQARYELAATYIEEDKYQQAIAALQPLTTNPDAKNYAAKAWSKIGFAYQAVDNDTKAIEAYKRVITDYPASEEKASALEALRSLYIENNQPEAYANLVKEYNLPSVGSASLDSTYYATAEAQIAAGKWANAKATLASYLEKFPNGFFTTKAHYYKAESHYQLKENEEALKEYDALLAIPWNAFSESSAKRAADIAYKSQNYTKAIYYYGLLRNNAIERQNLQLAFSGLMKSAYNGDQFDLAASYADTLATMPELDTTIVPEVQFFKARSLQRANKKEEALALYKQLQNAKSQSIAMESGYRVAEIYYEQNNLKEAETAASNMLKQNSGNDYWVVKSYLLIADILTKQNDYFNAKATLQSVIKNTKNPDLKKEATQKLDEVKKLEKQQTKLKD